MNQPRLRLNALVGLTIALLIAAACAPAAPPPAPTAPPAPAQPAAKPAETKPAASPAAKPAEAKPTASPAAKAEAKPAASAPPTKPAAAFDAKAIEEFYRGKTVRIVVGFAAGGTSDSLARSVARHMPQYLPGKPNIIVENKPGAGSILAANLLHASEPKDGTVIGSISEGLALQQAIGAQGIEFDAAKFNWLGSAGDDAYACMVHKDTGITSIQEVINGKEAIIGTLGPGSALDAPPAVLRAAVGANFRTIAGYDTAAKILLAVENREVDGVCLLIDGQFARRMLDGDNPIARALVVMGDRTPDRPYVKEAPAAETLAKTDETRLLLRAVHAPSRIAFPLTLPPGVPPERVSALRKALSDTVASAEFKDEVAKTGFILKPKSGEEVQRIIQDLLSTPRPILDKLKQILG